MSITIVAFGYIITFGTWGGIVKDTPDAYEDDDEDVPLEGFRDKGADYDDTPASEEACPAYFIETPYD